MDQRKYVVYIDDDEDDLMLMYEVLQHHPQLQLIHAYNGISGMDRIEDLVRQGHQPCLVILDINMPQMSGWEVLSKIRQDEAYHGFDVVMLSTSNSLLERERARRLGAELFTKPLDFRHLQQVVHTLLWRTCLL